MKVKSFIAFCLTVIVLLSSHTGVLGFASEFSQNSAASAQTETDKKSNEKDKKEENTETKNKGQTAAEKTNLDIKAKAAILIEPSTGTVIYEQNADEKLPEASVTKVMTILLAMEALDGGKLALDQKICCSDYAASMGGSQIWLEPGEEMTVDELLKATVVASANDAAVALGETISGSNEGFVALMNQRAAELGMTGTVYKNCTGLHEEGHYTTARDIATVTSELTTHKNIFNYTSIWMDNLRDGKTQLVNTNKLIRSYLGATGMKTGTTSEAGKCLSATAERDGLSLVAVVLGSETGDDRFNGARKLLDYGFSNYEMAAPEIPGDFITSIDVAGGMEKKAELSFTKPEKVLIKKGRGADITVTANIAEDIQAPVEIGQKVGEIVISLDGERIAGCDVMTKTSVDKVSIGNVFKKIFNSLIKLDK